MDIIKTIAPLYQQFFLFTLVMARIYALLFTFNTFRREMITQRLMLTLSLLLALIVYSSQTTTLHYYEFSLRLFVDFAYQMMIGILGGFILNVTFEIFMTLGQFVSMQIGLSAASLIDPRYGSVTSLSQMYVISSTLIFLLMNGHLFLVKTIADSFSYLPIGHTAFNPNMFMEIISYTKVIFTGAISLSLTILIIILLNNVSLAIMSKFAPQFNVFSIGINVSLVIGLALIYLTFEMFTQTGHEIIREGLTFFTRYLRGLQYG